MGYMPRWVVCLDGSYLPVSRIPRWAIGFGGLYASMGRMARYDAVCHMWAVSPLPRESCVSTDGLNASPWSYTWVDYVNPGHYSVAPCAGAGMRTYAWEECAQLGTQL